MKERPINCRPHEVRAILDGRKTMFRQVLKRQPVQDRFKHHHWLVGDDEGIELYCTGIGLERGIKFPYGNIGRRLWGRETFAVARFSLNPEYGDPSYFEWEKEYGDPYPHLGSCSALFYRADGEDNLPGELTEEKGLWNREIKWRPSILMPRWASRILLEITNVKVERLQDISEEDAMAEGAIITDYAGFNRYTFDSAKQPLCLSAKEAFINLWDSINGKNETKCWGANPFVWCIEFRRVEHECIRFICQH